MARTGDDGFPFVEIVRAIHTAVGRSRTIHRPVRRRHVRVQTTIRVTRLEYIARPELCTGPAGRRRSCPSGRPGSASSPTTALCWVNKRLFVYTVSH